MNKVTLKLEIDLDFVLIAVTSQLKDYRLCYAINKQLALEFYRIAELELIFDAPARSTFFNRYFYSREPEMTEFFILTNKGTDGYLIPEMNKVDYFLLIRNYIDTEDIEDLVNRLNRLPEVVVAAEVDPKKLRSKENLIF